VAIAALAVWVFTGAAGIALLRVVFAAKREAGPTPSPPETVPAADRAGAPGVAVTEAPAIPPAPQAAGQLPTPPPIPRVKVHARPGDHPLLEFFHPALAFIGVAFWFGFTFIHYRTFAWIGAGVLAVTIAVGLGWLAANTRTGHQRHIPARLVLLHGLAAATTCGFVVAAILTVSHA
jgi:hypothetical protein